MIYSSKPTIADAVTEQIARLAACIAHYPTTDSGLAGGDLGKVLYYFYRSRVAGMHSSAQQGADLLKAILHRINQKQDPRIMNPSLSSGLAGLGLTLEILVNEGFVEDDLDGYLERIDQLVFHAALKKIIAGDTDFLHGSVGGFHYLSYRLEKNPKVRGYLLEFVAALHELAIPDGDAAYLPNHFMQNWQKAKPNQIVIGLSHGMVAATLVLINLHEAGLAPHTTGQLIRQFVNFILKYENTRCYQPGVYGRFPNSVFLGEDPYSPHCLVSYDSGLRWCYGDMNITHLLYKASQALGIPAWADLARQTGLATLTIRDTDQAQCYGSLFCHGACGIAYYYRYLARISGETAYERAYEYWFEKAFDFFEEEMKQEKFLVQSGHFLEGFVGSSLILMADTEPEAPYWEKIWLLS